MKRILIFSLAYAPFVGGAEIAVKEITDRIPGCEFDLITLQFDRKLPRQERIGRVNVHRVGFGATDPEMKDLLRFSQRMNKLLFPFIAYRKARKLSRRENYAAIWSIMANYAGFAALFFKMRNPSIPFVLTLQEGDPIEHIKQRVGLAYPLFKRIFSSADIVQPISSYLGRFARSMGFSGQLEVIPNGVDFKSFSRTLPAAEIESLRAKLGRGSGDKLIITASRLVPKNGVGDIIRALKLLPQNVRLLVAGVGPLGEELAALAGELGLDARVIFLGNVPHEEIPRYLAASDVFVRPSLSEGMGNSFIEAMAAGIPVIATPVGGITDFLFDPEANPGKPSTGLFCRAQDPASIAAQVTKLLSSEQLRASLVCNAALMVERSYDWNLIAADMDLKVLRPAIERARKSPTLRILIAAGIYPPAVGGPAKYAKQLGDHWKREGHAVSVAAYRLEHSLPIGARHLLYFLRILPRVARADFIVAFDTLSVGLPAVLAARLFRKRIVIRAGGDFLWESYVERTGDLVLLRDFYQVARSKWSRKEKLIFFLTKHALQNASAIAFNSEFQRKIFISAYGLAERNACVILNHYGPKMPGEKPTEKNFIWAVRPLKLKNGALLREAFADAQAADPFLALDDHLTSHDELLRRIRSCYAVILPSITDISPNLILEAVQFGKPFICTTETGAFEALKDCGIFVDPTSKKALTEKILFLADEKNYQECARKVAAFELPPHGWSQIAAEFLALARGKRERE